MRVCAGCVHMDTRMARMTKTLSMGTAQAVSDDTILRNDSNLPAVGPVGLSNACLEAERSPAASRKPRMPPLPRPD